MIERSINWNRTTIFIELDGGNDGLNTIVPYSDPLYFGLRPNLAINAANVLKLNRELGFNPGLKPLLPLWNSGDLAAVLGLGYPNPNYSHFRGVDIWNTASNSNQILRQGWLTELFDEQRPPKKLAAEGLVLGRQGSMGPLEGLRVRALRLPKNPTGTLRHAQKMTPGETTSDDPALRHVVRQRVVIRQAADAMISAKLGEQKLGAEFPNSELGQQLKQVAQVLGAGIHVPVFKLSLSGFDTHGNQRSTHNGLMRDFAQAVSAFSRSMKFIGLWDQVVGLTYSEFGRRPAENKSAGTDHGSAAPHFVFGGRVRGGFYGEQPSLADMDDGNLRHTVHYRSLYASIAREWWGLKANFIREAELGLIA